MKSLKELQEERGEAVKAIYELREKETLDAEEQERWDRANADYDRLDAQVKRLERGQEIEERVAGGADRRETTPGREDTEVDEPDERAERDPDLRGRNRVRAASDAERALAIQGWLRAHSGLDLEERHREAVERCGVNLARPFLDITMRSDYGAVRRECRAAMSTSLTAGGDTIPEGFLNRFESALLAFGGIRRVAEVIRTASGNDLPIPTNNDTSNTGRLLSQNTQVTDTAVTTGRVILGAYKWSSDVILVPTELLEDSAFNLESFLGDKAGERIGRSQSAYFTTGTGSSQPNGIVTASTLGVTAASATAITADELIDLEHSVDPAYREQPGCGYMMHDTVVKVIRKLKDSDNRYLWEANQQVGMPDRLHGFPVTVNQSMASSVAASAKTVIFGAMRKFIIRDVGALRLKVLRERYADYDQIGVIAFMRGDSDLLDAGTHPVKYLQQLAAAGTGTGSGTGS